MKRVLSKGYLSISLLPPMIFKEILNKDKKAIQITNPYYDIVIKRLHLHYDMKVFTFSINEEKPDSPVSSFYIAIHTAVA